MLARRQGLLSQAAAKFRPVLAAVYVDPASSEATRAAALISFRALHQFAGVAILGQVFTAVWMALLAWEMRSAPVFRPWLEWLGLVGAALWPFGLAEGFATVLPVHVGWMGQVPMLAFGVMGIWMMASGVVLLWPPRRAR